MATAAIGFAALLCSAFGLSAALDTMLFAAYVRVPPNGKPPEHVAIVDVGTGQGVDEQALQGRLKALGATVIVPAASRGGPACAPLVDAGLAVRYPAGASARCAHIASAASRRWPEDVSLAPDFSMESSVGIPRVAAEHVLAADATEAWPARAIEGKAVLLERGWSRPVYATPLQRVDGPLGGVVFDALMLESLLTGRTLRWSGLWTEAVWLLGLLLMWTAWSRRSRPLGAGWARIGALGLLTLLASFALLRLGAVFVPQAATLAALAGAGVWRTAEQRRRVGRHLRRLQTLLAQATRRSGQDQWRAQPRPEAEEWAALADLALLHFGASRCWVLRLPEDALLLECAGCAPAGTPADPGIGRDLRALPFCSAEATGRAVELDAASLPACAQSQPDRDEVARRALLAPMLRSGEVFGFLVIELEADTMLASPRLLEEAADYADAAAKRLHMSRHAPSSSEAASSEYALPSAPALHVLAADAVTQLDTLRDLMSASPQPGATLSLDGQVLFSNKAFADFALVSGIPLLSIGLQGMLTSLCGLSAAQAARETRRMLLYGAMLECPMTEGRVPSATTLRAYAVERGGQRTQGRRAIQDALLAHGVVLELLPAAQADARLIALCEAGERLVADTRLELEALRTALTRPRGETVESTQAQAGVERLHSALDGFARHLRLERMHEGQVRGICDLHLLLEASVYALSPQLQERGLILQIEGAAELPASATPELARTTIEAILALLLQDAANDSTIHCLSRQEPGASILTIRNCGFGVPDWHLRDLRERTGRPGPSDDALERLLAAIHPVHEAGGALTVDSTLGEGFVVTLRMPVPDR